jgi:hypothetical protein
MKMVVLFTTENVLVAIFKRDFPNFLLVVHWYFFLSLKINQRLVDYMHVIVLHRSFGQNVF